MSYRTIKEYVTRRMNSLGYSESGEKFDFDQESDLAFDRSYIVENPSTDIEDGNTLGLNFYPVRKMVVKVAWQLSEKAVYDYDLALEAIDFIIKDLHNPTNYIADSIKNFQYKSHIVRAEKNYLVAEISFNVTDSLSFS